MNRFWMFVGLTYDPVTKKAYAFLNNQYTEMPIASSGTQHESGESLRFGGHAPFMVDNVFYLPKFSTAEEISVVHEKSMFKF